jgi:NDP-sugar pyrophosphorylase family protein
MAKFDVIITCSGLGTRLLPYTNYLNKSLIKIGDQPAISHILNMYPSDTKFIITLGYLSDHIKDYLSIVHSDKDITYVYVDNYNGPGSSLLYSLSKTFPLINKPFVFNACDTIVHNMNCKFNKENIALATTSTFDNQYRKFNKYIEDHPATYGEDCYIGLCYINDYQKFISIANSLLLTQCDNLSDAHVLQKLDIKKKIILQSDWIDIGNHASLSKARNKFNNKICVLEKENEETYYDNVKMSSAVFGKAENVFAVYVKGGVVPAVV